MAWISGSCGDDGHIHTHLQMEIRRTGLRAVLSVYQTLAEHLDFQGPHVYESTQAYYTI